MKRFAAMQRDFEVRLEEMTVRLKENTDLTARQQIATEETMRMAQEAHGLALSLYRHFVYGDALSE